MTKQIKMAQTKEKNNVIRTLTKTIHVGMRVFGYLIKIYFIKDLFKIKEKKHTKKQEQIDIFVLHVRMR